MKYYLAPCGHRIELPDAGDARRATCPLCRRDAGRRFRETLARLAEPRPPDPALMRLADDGCPNVPEGGA